MDSELILICVLTGVINLIGALAYAARIAGVRTGRIALSFALFNILVLVSRPAEMTIMQASVMLERWPDYGEAA